MQKLFTICRRYISVIILAAALLCIGIGFVQAEHKMIFSHAIVVCLSCIGLG